MKRLIILGAGDYGRTVGDIASQMKKYDEVQFLDDSIRADDVMDTCANFVLYMDDDTEFYPAFTDNVRRMELLNSLMSLGCTLATVIHPTAYVSQKATVIAGCAVLSHATVHSGCMLKMGCIVDDGATVEQGCILEEGAYIGRGAIVKAENKIPRCMKTEAEEIIESRKYPIKGV